MQAMPPTLDAVLRDPPAVHDDERNDRVVTFGLADDVLRWLLDVLPDGARTLETGAGLSTLAFALAGAEHVCITPAASEPARLRTYARERGISLDRVRFETAESERLLPGLDPAPLDLVLIDGSHSFPQPFIDWFYTHPHLRVGGHVVVDDTHVWTGRVLRDFLVAEPEWAVAREWFGRAVAFRKVAPTDPGKLWLDQPLVVRRSITGSRLRLRAARDMLRAGEARELAARAARMARRRLGRERSRPA
jgi:predicted O-methyltransferase YrrM